MTVYRPYQNNMTRKGFGNYGWGMVFSFCAALLTFYFLYHTFEGPRGLRHLWQIKREVVAATQTLESLKQQHQDLERRVRLMRPNGLDTDLLEEKSRELLGYTKPGDIVVLAPETIKNPN